MNVSIKSAVVSLVVVLATSTAFAQIDFTWTGDGNQVTFGGNFDVVNADALAADATLAGAYTFNMLVDSTADILLVDAALTVTEGTFYNVGVAELGSDVNPPQAAVLPAFPKLNADSWVTTPNAGTSAAGTNALDEVGTLVTHFDTVSDGPQTAFQFAKITIIPDDKGAIGATLTGTVQTAADPTPIFDNFTYTMGVPEPTSMGLVLSALLGGLAIIRRKRN